MKFDKYKIFLSQDNQWELFGTFPRKINPQGG